MRSCLWRLRFTCARNEDVSRNNFLSFFFFFFFFLRGGGLKMSNRQGEQICPVCLWHRHASETIPGRPGMTGAGSHRHISGHDTGMASSPDL